MLIINEDPKNKTLEWMTCYNITDDEVKIYFITTFYDYLLSIMNNDWIHSINCNDVFHVFKTSNFINAIKIFLLNWEIFLVKKDHVGKVIVSLTITIQLYNIKMYQRNG